MHLSDNSLQDIWKCNLSDLHDGKVQLVLKLSEMLSELVDHVLAYSKSFGTYKKKKWDSPGDA